MKAPDLIVIIEAQCVIQPSPTPPVPAEAFSIPGAHEVASDLLLNPISDVTEAATGGTDTEVVHPAAHDGIDQVDDPLDRLRAEASENGLQLPEQLRPRLHDRDIHHPFLTGTGGRFSKLKAEETEVPPFSQINHTGLLLVDLHTKLAQFLVEPFFAPQPVASPSVGIRQQGRQGRQQNGHTRYRCMDRFE